MTSKYPEALVRKLAYQLAKYYDGVELYSGNQWADQELGEWHERSAINILDSLGYRVTGAGEYIFVASEIEFLGDSVKNRVEPWDHD